MTPLVLKLGGSLTDSGQMREVLERVARSTRPLIIVPGGGVFADTVRAAQRTFGIPDETAHRIAVLAMQQMALLISDMQPKLKPAKSIADFEEVWRQARIPVWLPFEMVDGDPSVPRTWSMTSDGLAAWLATQRQGTSVALVKSCSVPPNANAQALAAAGIVDTEFARIVVQNGLDWHVIGWAAADTLDQLILAR